MAFGFVATWRRSGYIVTLFTISSTTTATTKKFQHLTTQAPGDTVQRKASGAHRLQDLAGGRLVAIIENV